MAGYRALAIDLDGTLLIGEDLPEPNLAAVRRAQEAGYAIIIATARWRQMALRISKEIGISGPVIACSGAEVFDPTTGSDVFDERLPDDFTDDLFAICDANRCVATVTFTERVLLKLDGRPDESQMSDEMEWVPQLNGADPSSPRVAAIQGSTVNQMIREELLPRYDGRVNYFDSIGPNGKTIATITSVAASKGVALKAACRHLSLDTSTVIAFGDAENDIAMFDIAGASVAMGQADEITKSRATAVAPPNTEFGVAHAIDALLETGAV